MQLKLCAVSDKYIDYLSKQCKEIYYSKEEYRIHTRKYVGIILAIGQYTYYAPLSSPKNTDYLIRDGKKIIRNSIVPIIRIIEGNKSNKYELYGPIRLSNMIPVPLSEIQYYDIQAENDDKYKSLIRKELVFISKNEKKILNYANVLYKQKLANDNIGYVKTTLDFLKLEKLCDKYCNETVENTSSDAIEEKPNAETIEAIRESK